MASGEWYYLEKGQPVGPVAGSTLRERARAGLLQPSDLVLRAGSPTWKPAGTFRGWFAAPAALPSVAEPAAGVEDTSSPPAQGFREEFLSWLAAHPQAKPLYQFRARAGRAAEIPHFALAFPLGDVLAVPGFLAFLTDSDQEPGLGLALTSIFGQLAGQQAGGGLKDLVNIVRGTPCTVLQDEGVLSKALQSPNSFFVPFREITEVEFQKAIPVFRTSRIRIKCRAESYVLCEDEKAEGLVTSMRTLFSRQWHSEFLRLLTDAAKNSSRTRTRKET